MLINMKGCTASTVIREYMGEALGSIPSTAYIHMNPRYINKKKEQRIQID
jgi:hypothetical protein